MAWMIFWKSNTCAWVALNNKLNQIGNPTLKKTDAVRDDYYYFSTIETRWMDNDVYGHINNVNYYSYFDTVVNNYLIEKGGLDIHKADVVGFVVSSSCEYRQPIAHPSTIHAGFRVNKLGNKSVEYGVAIFSDNNPQASAYGTVTHVFVKRASGQSCPIPEKLRTALSKAI